jgi:hypothetical protein
MLATEPDMGNLPYQSDIPSLTLNPFLRLPLTSRAEIAHRRRAKQSQFQTVRVN